MPFDSLLTLLWKASTQGLLYKVLDNFPISSLPDPTSFSPGVPSLQLFFFVPWFLHFNWSRGFLPAPPSHFCLGIWPSCTCSLCTGLWGWCSPQANSAYGAEEMPPFSSCPFQLGFALKACGYWWWFWCFPKLILLGHILYLLLASSPKLFLVKFLLNPDSSAHIHH